MNIGNLLGAMLQSGMAPSSKKRLENAFGDDKDRLLEDLMRNRSGGMAGMLGQILSQAGQTAGGQQNLALGGLGALAGALLGGGRRSAGGALGGGAMALLGAMAFKALQGARQGTGKVPLGLIEPRTEDEKQQLEQQEGLVLRAMINAAKSDGQIDEKEIDRIVGKLGEMGSDADDQRYVMTQMQKPMETDTLILAAKGEPELAAEIYAASLLAVEVDTQAEKNYLAGLASGLGLTPDVTRAMEQMVGM